MAPKPAARHVPWIRILIAGIGVAAIYCGFIALVANANARGGRAGLDFARVTIVLAITTPAGALGALIATGLSGRVPSFFMMAASVLGTSACGIALTVAGLDFAWLTASLWGVIAFIYIGVPSIYHGISMLDQKGDSAAHTQGTQFLGTVIGPAAGAIIATQRGLASRRLRLSGLPHRARISYRSWGPAPLPGWPRHWERQMSG